MVVELGVGSNETIRLGGVVHSDSDGFACGGGLEHTVFGVEGVGVVSVVAVPEVGSKLTSVFLHDDVVAALLVSRAN